MMTTTMNFNAGESRLWYVQINSRQTNDFHDLHTYVRSVLPVLRSIHFFGRLSLIMVIFAVLIHMGVLVSVEPFMV